MQHADNQMNFLTKQKYKKKDAGQMETRHFLYWKASTYVRSSKHSTK